MLGGVLYTAAHSNTFSKVYASNKNTYYFRPYWISSSPDSRRSIIRALRTLPGYMQWQDAQRLPLSCTR
jgi:hypothetical protein